MGFIYILIGIIILSAVNKSEKTPSDPDFDFDNIEKYTWLIMNPTWRLLLKIGGGLLIIIGVISLFS